MAGEVQKQEERRWGHFVLAYALADPTKSDAQITIDDILVHDAGHKDINTLRDYEMKQIGNSFLAANPAWLDDRSYLHHLPSGRLRLYSPISETTPANPSLQFSVPNPNVYESVLFQVHSPVELVVTNPSGQRSGYDPDIGVINENPLGTSWVDIPYTSLDEFGEPESVGDLNDLVKNVSLSTAAPGEYTLEVIGTGNGDFTILVDAGTNLTSSLDVISGTTTAGQRQMFTIMVSSAVTEVPGDYNGNGTVDTADYVLWRKGGPLINEVDAPGVVNAADYTEWRARFGNAGSGAGASAIGAVPEPTSLVLLILGAAGGGVRRGQGRAGSTNNYA
jgi:hypothetical protein